jgi:hypothetical protein
MKRNLKAGREAQAVIKALDLAMELTRDLKWVEDDDTDLIGRTDRAIKRAIKLLAQRPRKGFGGGRPKI